MSVAGLAACVALAVYSIVSGFAAALLWRRFEATGGSERRGLRPGRVLLKRVFPAMLGVAAAGVLALPCFLAFEPRHAAPETPGLIASGLALAGLLSVLRGLWRGASDGWATYRLRRQWSSEARPLAIAGAPAPAFAIRHAFPVVSVVGTFRPRLFVAEHVLASLSPDEMQAVLAHEAAHVASRDNLKRLGLRLCPRPLWSRAARRLEEGWERAAEEAADARVPNPLDLAAALLKTARLVPAGGRIDVPAAAFHRGGPLERRVRLLVDPVADHGSAAPTSHPAALAAAAVIGLVTFVLAARPDAFVLLYGVLERLVHLP
jgi:hypothetical protein